jgi:hypothetical protein
VRASMPLSSKARIAFLTVCEAHPRFSAISTSSNSSICSKWRFSTPSLERGHSLSEGWNSGKGEGRYSRCIPSGTSRSFFAVCQAALSTTTTMRFFFPAPTSLATILVWLVALLAISRSKQVEFPATAMAPIITTYLWDDSWSFKRNKRVKAALVLTLCFFICFSALASRSTNR